MELLLQRIKHNDQGTLSLLFVGLELYAFVPEDPPQAVKVKGRTRIPEGRYRVTLEHSPRFSDDYAKRFKVDKYLMLGIAGVPGFSGIRFHIGNSAEDTEGCVLPNAQCVINPEGRDTFGLSTPAYEKFYREVAPFVAEGGECWITVRDEHAILFAPSPRPITIA